MSGSSYRCAYPVPAGTFTGAAGRPRRRYR